MEQKVSTQKESKKKKQSKIIIIIILIIAFILMLFSVSFALFYSMNSKIVFGVSIQGIKVSGLTKEETESKFMELIENVSKKDLVLQHEDYETTINLGEFGINYHIDEAINEACMVGRNSNIFKNNFDILQAGLSKKNIEIPIDYDEASLSNKLSTVMSSLPGAVIEPNYYIEDQNLVIVKGKSGLAIQSELLTNLIVAKIKSLEANPSIIDIPTTHQEPSLIDLDKIHSEIFKEPKDAYVTQDPLTVHPNVNGIDFAVSIEEAKNIINEDKEEYIIPLKITVAAKTISDLGEEAFPNVLGTFTTRYDASNKNRSNNISLATKKINSTVILPGETFSYNKTVGKRTIESGYKEAGAYAGGMVVQSIGGGICQVSSTLYNAVLYANLEIVDRSNHYFQASYVDAGRDATVSWGGPDFKFKNNRQYPIKIEATSKNGVTKVSIKGIKEEKEYEIIIQSEVTSIIQKSIKYEEDPNLDSTIEVVDQEGHNGCTSKAYRIRKLNGALISKEELSSDYYHYLEKIVRKGTKESESSISETESPSSSIPSEPVETLED